VSAGRKPAHQLGQRPFAHEGGDEPLDRPDHEDREHENARQDERKPARNGTVWIAQ
jgi:hypothetical protein